MSLVACHNYNHRIIKYLKLEGTCKDLAVQALAPLRTAQKTICLRVLSWHFMNFTKLGAMTTSLLRLFQCLNTLSVKIIYSWYSTWIQPTCAVEWKWPVFLYINCISFNCSQLAFSWKCYPIWHFMGIKVKSWSKQTSWMLVAWLNNFTDRNSTFISQ